MDKKRNPIVIIAALILVLVGGYFLYAEVAGLSEGERVLLLDPMTPIPYADGAGFEVDAAHDFSFMSHTDEEVSLFDYIGRPMLLHFWNGESDAVLAELQALDRAYREYGEEIVFLPVHTMGAQTRGEAEALFGRQSLALPMFFDEDGSAMRACGASQAPVTYFIDADGFIAAASTGSIDEETLLFGLSLLSDLTPATPEASPAPDAKAAPEE